MNNVSRLLIILPYQYVIADFTSSYFSKTCNPLPSPRCIFLGGEGKGVEGRRRRRKVVVVVEDFCNCLAGSPLSEYREVGT